VTVFTAEQVEVGADPREQYERAIAERWSDGAPLLPATDDAIEALLAATPYPADHALCVLPPVNGVATVELIAINAAMAGVEPAAFPVVIAALEAIFAMRRRSHASLPIPCGSRAEWAITNNLFRRWGAPTPAADSTPHSASYPHSAKSPRTRPNPMERCPGTFSKQTNFGSNMRMAFRI